MYQKRRHMHTHDFPWLRRSQNGNAGLYKTDSQRVIVDVLTGSGLTRNESFAVVLRECQGMTFNEIGKEFGLTRQRCREIYLKAMRKLRHPSRLNILEELKQ